ncbi:MAG: phage holin family protein [Pseudomonadota bacterium]
MALAESASRLVATLVAMIQTRMELAAVELEEESQRFLGYLLAGLLALFLLAIAVVLLAFFVVLLFWDTYRLQAVLGMAAVFALSGIVLGMKVRASVEAKPRMLEATLGELNKDIEFIKSVGAPREP